MIVARGEHELAEQQSRRRSGQLRGGRRGVSMLAGPLLGLSLVAAACSHRQTAAKTGTASESAAPVTPTVTAATSPPAAPATPTISPSTSRRATPSPSSPRPGASPTASAGAPAAAPSSPVTLPALGTYVYALSGTTQSPLLGLGSAYQPGATLAIDFYERNPQPGGTETAAKTTSAQDNAQTTTQWLWQADKVVLTSSNLTFLGLASYDCTYAPAPEVLPLPLRTVTLPDQAWSGSQCSGDVEVAVKDLETVTAAGRSWPVWRVTTHLHYVAQSTVDATVDTTSLFSPELGTVVTSDTATRGMVAGSPFASHQVTTLTSHP